MKRRRASRKSGRKRTSSLARRRLLFEALESRTLLALLQPGAFAEAFSDFQGNQVGPVSNSDPVNAVAEAISGPLVNFPGLVFQESAHTEATTFGPVLGRSLSGGIFPNVNPNNTVTCETLPNRTGLVISPRQPSNPAATVSCSRARATGNWIVSGVPSGTMVDVDVEVQIAGHLETVRFNNTNAKSVVDTSLELASGLTPMAAVLFAAKATLSNAALSRTGPWTFSQVAGSNARYETNHTSTVTFPFPAGEPFSLQATLDTFAESPGPFEVFAYSDFFASGFTYTVSTSAPGAVVIPLGAAERGEIRGTVFEDRDSDGNLNSDESGVPGRWLHIDTNANGLRDVGEVAVQSDAAGAFRFESLAAGTYHLMQELPAAWVQTAPVSGPWIISLNQNQVSTGHNFGTVPLPGRIHGTVRLRQSGGLPDGIIEGIRVYLDSDGDHRFDITEPSTLTDRLGDFQFPNLYPGRHDVKLVLPAGAAQELPNYFMERGYVVNLAPQEQRHVEFLLTDAGSISGTKYLDKNSNGIIEFGEPLVSRQIFIDYNRDGMLDDAEPRVLTDSLGRYRFDNLPPGSYWLRDFAGQVIPAPDPSRNHSFGHAGMFAGDSLVISDPDASATNPATGQLEPIGRVYVVDMTSGSVTELAGPNPAIGPEFREHFGWSVAVNDTTIAVGSPITDFDDTVLPAGLFATTLDGEQLLIMDETTGVGTPVAGLAAGIAGLGCLNFQCDPPSSIKTIEFDAEGNLFAAVSVDADSDRLRDDTLILSVNTSDGHVASAGARLIDITVTALEVHPVTGQMFATILSAANPTSSQLVKLLQDPGGASSSYLFSTVIGTTNLGRIGGLTIDDAGRFFVVESGSGLLAELDPQTGAASPIATTGFSDVASLEFDPSFTHMLAGLGASEFAESDGTRLRGYLASITRSGVGSVIGPSGFNDLSGLSFRLRRLGSDLVGTADDGGYRIRDPEPRPESGGHVYLFDRTTGLFHRRLDAPRSGNAYGVSLASLGVNGFAIGAPAIPQSIPTGYVDLVSSDGALNTRLSSDPPGGTRRWGRFGLSLAATRDSLVIREDGFSQYHLNVPTFHRRYLAYDHAGQLRREENPRSDLTTWLPTLSPQRFDYVAIGDLGDVPPYGPGPGLRDIDFGVVSCGGRRSGELMTTDDRPQLPPGAVVGLKGHSSAAAVGYPADNRVLAFVDECYNPGALRPFYIPWPFWADRIELPEQYAQVDSQFGYSLATDATGTRLLIGDPGGDQSPGQTFLVSLGQHIEVTESATSRLDFRSLDADTDDDGIGDPVENGAPNQGDGNRDGIPDAHQPNVASLLNAVNGNYVTFAAPDDVYLKRVVAHRDVPDYHPPPPNAFPLGFFEMVVERNWPHDSIDSLGLTDIEFRDHTVNSNLTTTPPLTFHRVEPSDQGHRWVLSLEDQPGNPLIFQVAGDGTAPSAAAGFFGGPSAGPIAVYSVTESSSPPPPIIENNPWRLYFEAGLTRLYDVTIGVDWDNNGTIDQTAVHHWQSGGRAAPFASISGAFLPSGSNTIRIVIDPDGVAQEYFHTVDVIGEFDNDDVLDSIEDAAPNNGDGNNDGVPDSRQAHVASLPNAVDGSYITLVAPPGLRLHSVSAFTAAERSYPPAPPPLQFPVGLVDFRMDLVPFDTVVTVVMIVHGPVVPNAYYKYTNEGWIDFSYEDRTGATFAGNVITLDFVDNGRGDGDPLRGRIYDPGGPAILVRPTLQVEGPEAGVRSQLLEFQFHANPAGDYTYEIDWDGDGTADQSLAGTETLIVEHAFANAEGFSIQVIATDVGDRSSDQMIHDVSIDIAAVINGDLLVGGTVDDDQIHFYGWPRHAVRVRVNGSWLGPFALPADGRLTAFGGEGDDRIQVSNNLHRDVLFFGGPGDDDLRGGSGDDLLDGGPGSDHLFGSSGDDLLDGGDGDDRLFGSFGNSILVGGGGNDHLYGGFGRDLLIGGTGRDRLFGLFGQHILVSGSTFYDNDHEALRDILAEWARPAPYAARVETLRDSSRSVYLKRGETVLDDDSVDWLFGGLGRDWFLFDPDKDKRFGYWHGEAVN